MTRIDASRTTQRERNSAPETPLLFQLVKLPRLEHREPGAEAECSAQAPDACRSRNAAWEWIALRFGVFEIRSTGRTNIEHAYFRTADFDAANERAEWKTRRQHEVIAGWKAAEGACRKAVALMERADKAGVRADVPGGNTPSYADEREVFARAARLMMALIDEETRPILAGDDGPLLPTFYRVRPKLPKRGRGEKIAGNRTERALILNILRVLADARRGRLREPGPMKLRGRDAAIVAVAFRVDPVLRGSSDTPLRDLFNERMKRWSKVISGFAANQRRADLRRKRD